MLLGEAAMQGDRPALPTGQQQLLQVPVAPARRRLLGQVQHLGAWLARRVHVEGEEDLSFNLVLKVNVVLPSCANAASI